MRKDHRPYWIKLFCLRISNWYTERFIRPQFESLGVSPMVIKPRSCEIHGKCIVAGNYLHVISHPLQPIRLTTWSSKTQTGRITIGNYCLISPGVEITAAVGISIGDNAMIGAGSSIQDCDWHGLYNRTRPFRCSKAIHIADNVWIGARSILCKGVNIGENSVIGAGSVVTHNIPANVVAAGNPAKIVKHLNPKRRMLKREFLFKQGDIYWQNQTLITQYLTADNSLLKWLKTRLKPSTLD